MSALRPFLRTAAAFSRATTPRLEYSGFAPCYCAGGAGSDGGTSHGHRNIGVAAAKHQQEGRQRVDRVGGILSLRASSSRWISSTPRALHGDHEAGFEDAESVELTWENAKGDRIKTEAKCGMNLMRVAHAHHIDLEGACEGVCACSTCHVILSGEVFDELPEPSEDEEDMLDMAFGLTETSRLGCQVIVTPEMAGIVVKLPAATRNFYVDGHVPQPH